MVSRTISPLSIPVKIIAPKLGDQGEIKALRLKLHPVFNEYVDGAEAEDMSEEAIPVYDIRAGEWLTDRGLHSNARNRACAARDRAAPRDYLVHGGIKDDGSSNTRTVLVRQVGPYGGENGRGG